MSRSQNGSAMFVILNIRTKEITVTAQYFFCLRIPNNQLFIRIFHDIVFIDIQRFSRSPACRTKSNLTQTSDFLHYIRRILSCNDINLIMALVGRTQTLLFGQFRFQKLLTYRFNNLFHIFLLVVLLLKLSSIIYKRYLLRKPPTRQESSIYQKSARK